MDEIGFYRLNDVLKILPICKSLWFKGIREGKYPSPIKHGASSLWPKKGIHNLVRQIEKNGGESDHEEE